MSVQWKTLKFPTYLPTYLPIKQRTSLKKELCQIGEAKQYGSHDSHPFFLFRLSLPVSINNDCAKHLAKGRLRQNF